MKVLNIAPESPYNEGWGYQDNLLPKYQARLDNNDVTLVITTKTHQNGKIEETEQKDYFSEDGFRVVRRPVKYVKALGLGKLLFYIDVNDILQTVKPDLIFLHGLSSITIFQVIEYKKRNPNVVIVRDNHLDYNIGYKPSSSLKSKVICYIYRFLNKITIKYVDKVYCVTPWRKKYAEDVFGIPKNKTDVLIMGADDEKIDFINRDTIKERIRSSFNLTQDDFLVVTGGKIDANKKIDVLIRACAGLEKVYLLVFGELLDDCKASILNLIEKHKNILFIGWISSDRVYDYFLAADLVFFPGQHSVLWEQACACKVPCVFADWDCMHHVDNGGNSCFLKELSEDSIRKKIISLHFTAKYYQMFKCANSDITDIYLYSNIAKKSLELVTNDV